MDAEALLHHGHDTQHTLEEDKKMLRINRLRGVVVGVVMVNCEG